MPADLAESRALAGIDDATCAILRDTWPLIREGVPAALRAAFASVLARDTAPDAATRAQIEAARDGQARHWEALFAARFDEEYAASLRRMAVTHARVGLDPRWLVAGYLTTLTELHSLILAGCNGPMLSWAARSRLDRAIRAVDQAVLFDLQLCVAAYTEELANLHRAPVFPDEEDELPPTGMLLEAIMPADAEGRRVANQLFVAAQRRTFHTERVPVPTVEAA
jgi:hypothetical protein